jgi:hypothetical protein
LKIAIAVNYWDDPEGLMRLLKSIPLSIIYKVYLIDGRYSGRYDSPVYKDEMTEAIVHSMSDYIHYVKMYNVKQIDKRNKYWELAENDEIDWMIVIDSDEYIEVDEPVMFERYLLKLEEDWPDSRCFPVAGNNMGHFFAMPRLFKKPFNYRHIQQEGKISHGSIYDPNGKEIIDEMYRYYNHMRKERGKDGADACVHFISMVHDKGFRTIDRINKDYVYYNDNKER